MLWDELIRLPKRPLASDDLRGRFRMYAESSSCPVRCMWPKGSQPLWLAKQTVRRELGFLPKQIKGGWLQLVALARITHLKKGREANWERWGLITLRDINNDYAILKSDTSPQNASIFNIDKFAVGNLIVMQKDAFTIGEPIFSLDRFKREMEKLNDNDPRAYPAKLLTDNFNDQNFSFDRAELYPATPWAIFEGAQRTKSVMFRLGADGLMTARSWNR